MGSVTAWQIFYTMQLLVQLPKMPLEILALIFEDVGPFDFALSLSDNLAPFIPSNRYAKLQLSYPAFLELCTRLRGDPHLAKFVVELAITFTSGNCFDYDLNDEEFVFDFLRSATSLTSLSVKHNPRFRSRVLSAKFVVASYAALKTLSFDHESPNPPNSLSHQYRYLALTPPLDRLSITWEFGESDLLDEPVFTAEESAELEAGDVLALAAAGITVLPAELKIEMLELSAGRLDREGVVEFVRKCRSLQVLSLEFRRGAVQIDLGDLLAAVNPNIRCLWMDCPEGSESMDVMMELRLDVNTFPELTSLLLLDRECSPSLLLGLSKLPKLQHLQFRSSPDYYSIRQLLSRRFRPPSLDCLWIEIDQERNERGVSRDDSDYNLREHYDAESGTLSVGSGWFWNTSGDGSGIDEIFQLANEAGVVLAGDWKEAARAADAHEMEIICCAGFHPEEHAEELCLSEMEEFEDYVGEFTSDDTSWTEKESDGDISVSQIDDGGETASEKSDRGEFVWVDDEGGGVLYDDIEQSSDDEGYDGSGDKRYDAVDDEGNEGGDEKGPDGGDNERYDAADGRGHDGGSDEGCNWRELLSGREWIEAEAEEW